MPTALIVFEMLYLSGHENMYECILFHIIMTQLHRLFTTIRRHHHHDLQLRQISGSDLWEDT